MICALEKVRPKKILASSYLYAFNQDYFQYLCIASPPQA